MKNAINRKKVCDLIFGIGVSSWNRLPVFVKRSIGLTDKEYWFGLGQAYIDSDNLYQWRKLVKAAFSIKRPDRNYLMSAKERKRFSQLPEVIRIYRGMTKSEFQSGDFGISWTLDRKEAKWFIDTYQRNYSTRKLVKTVHSIKVNKADIIAIFTERGEEEIIYIHKPFRNGSAIIKKHIETYNDIYDPFGEIKMFFPGQ